MNDMSASSSGAAEHLEMLRLETQSVLRYMAVEFSRQLQFSDNELTQTQSLLKDAIDTLTECFSGINEQLAQHPGIRLSHLSRREKQSKEGDSSPLTAEPEYAGTSELEQLLNTAVRTLQFQDLTKQLVDHALHRVTAMRGVLGEIQAASETQNWASLAELLEHLRESIARHVAIIDEHKTNPVSQGHMRTGEIELF